MAMELVEEDDPHQPAGALATEVTRACLEEGVLVITAGPSGNVIRVLSPLVITDEELERGLGVIEDAVLRLSGGGDGPGDRGASDASVGAGSADAGVRA